MFQDPLPQVVTAASESIAALQDAQRILDSYYREVDREFGGQFNEIGVEARKRLDQMMWLLAEVRRQHELAFSAQQPTFQAGDDLQSGLITKEEWAERVEEAWNGGAHEIFSKASQAIETLSEAFYWIAFRTRNAIRSLPRLNRFEAVGVRDVRNKLLEHPDKGDSGIMMTSFGWGHPCGPVVKAVRLQSQSSAWVDRGLFVNATEFAAELSRKLLNL